MKKILVIFFCLILNLIFCCDVHAYGVRVQKDFRYTTQQDRNQRIKAYKDYLEKQAFLMNRIPVINKILSLLKKIKTTRKTVTA